MINKGLDDIKLEQDHHLQLERNISRRNDKVREAFHKWQETAEEWSDVYRSFKQESGSLLFERKRQLRALEKRLNDAADAYEQARQQASEYSVLSLLS
jgi:hypothetical protein